MVTSVRNNPLLHTMVVEKVKRSVRVKPQPMKRMLSRTLNTRFCSTIFYHLSLSITLITILHSPRCSDAIARPPSRYQGMTCVSHDNTTCKRFCTSCLPLVTLSYYQHQQRQQQQQNSDPHILIYCLQKQLNYRTKTLISQSQRHLYIRIQEIRCNGRSNEPQQGCRQQRPCAPTPRTSRFSLAVTAYI
jgi:hypothetical protein